MLALLGWRIVYIVLEKVSEAIIFHVYYVREDAGEGTRTRSDPSPNACLRAPTDRDTMARPAPNSHYREQKMTPKDDTDAQMLLQVVSDYDRILHASWEDRALA